MMRQLLLILSFMIATQEVFAVVVTQQVKKSNKLISKCVLDFKEKRIEKTEKLLAEVGELDYRGADLLALVKVLGKEPTVPVRVGRVSDKPTDIEIQVTVKTDQLTLLRGKDKTSSTRVIRVGPNSVKFFKLIEKYCSP